MGTQPQAAASRATLPKPSMLDGSISIFPLLNFSCKGGLKVCHYFVQNIWESVLPAGGPLPPPEIVYYWRGHYIKLLGKCLNHPKTKKQIFQQFS